MLGKCHRYFEIFDIKSSIRFKIHLHDHTKSRRSICQREEREVRREAGRPPEFGLEADDPSGRSGDKGHVAATVSAQGSAVAGALAGGELRLVRG